MQTGADGYKSVAYSKLVAPLIEAVKHLYQRLIAVEQGAAINTSEIDKLKAENAEKTKQIEALKAYLCSKDPQAPVCK